VQAVILAAIGRSTVEFNVGDKVVYPCHGVAEGTDIATRTVFGEETTYVVFSIAERMPGRHGLMTVSVPVSRAAEVGVRQIASREDADDVLAVLSVTDVRVPANWSRRFKNHQEKLKTGDLFQYAEVVRNLAARSQNKSLAAAETAMYGTARHLLSTELAVTWSISQEAAEARVDEALGASVTAMS
jgi:CarD family transcriptional regulator